MIPIRNVYYMLAYAFRDLRQMGFEEASAEKFDHLHDLLAAMLAHGLSRLVKQGLYRDYVVEEETLAGVRGRMQMGQTVKTLAHMRGKLVCAFDEFTADTPHNRILKSTARLLLHHGEVTLKQRLALRRILPLLSGVTDIEPRMLHRDGLRIHRNNASYRVLLGICDLVLDDLLPNKHAGNYHLSSWLSDEAMHRLYENFVLAWYKYHRPQLKPRAAEVQWNLGTNASSHYLPRMKTDVLLSNGDRSLIIDTKYYKSAWQQHALYGHQSYISSHLYQIHAYVKNYDVEATGKVSGVLLYAGTDEHLTPDESFTLGGNQFALRTLDLNQDWAGIAGQLASLCSYL